MPDHRESTSFLLIFFLQKLAKPEWIHKKKLIDMLKCDKDQV